MSSLYLGLFCLTSDIKLIDRSIYYCGIASVSGTEREVDLGIYDATKLGQKSFTIRATHT